MERRISDRFSVQIRDRSLREIKKKKKKTRESRVQIYQSPCSTTVFRIFDLDERNGGVITVNERIKGDELEEGKSGKQREKYESRNDTRTEEERRNREGETRRERKRKEEKQERERERNCVSTRLLFVVYSQLPFIPHLFPTLNIHIALERAIIHNGLYRTFL